MLERGLSFAGQYVGNRGAVHRPRIRSSVVVAAFGLLTAGCGDLFGPGIPDGAIRLLPVPSEYTAWWHLAERCSGITGEFSHVDWGVVPGAETIPGSDGAVGTYYRNRHQIILIERGIYDGHLVRHEMLHALRKERGHPREIFVDRCGGLVSCAGPCRDEAERTRPPAGNVPIVDTRTLQVSLELFPDSLSRSAGSGCVTVVVNVRNPHTQTVGVRTWPLGAIGWSVNGISGGSDGASLPIESTRVLEPGALASYAFDCPDLIDALPPGEHFIRGRVGSGRSAPVPLRITV